VAEQVPAAFKPANAEIVIGDELLFPSLFSVMMMCKQKEQWRLCNVTFEPGCCNNQNIHKADKGGKYLYGKLQ